MAGRKTLAITDRQYQLLQLVWENGPLTVRELIERLPRGSGQPYTTVLGMVQHMERLGLLAHDKEGLTHRYRPVLSKTAVTSNLLRDFLGRFFGGSAQALLQGLVDADALSPEDLREIQAKLTEAGETGFDKTTSQRKRGRPAP
ncbi:MAG: BlaI/MecI/CopY family transcriptional regulator [Thermoguttaceae bacterium]